MTRYFVFVARCLLTKPVDCDRVSYICIDNAQRQPFGLYTHPIHIATGYPGVADPTATIAMINDFVDWAQQQANVWIVSSEQLLDWVRNPVPVDQLNTLPSFQCALPAVEPKICNGMHPNEDGLLNLCPFSEFPFYTCVSNPFLVSSRARQRRMDSFHVMLQLGLAPRVKTRANSASNLIFLICPFDPFADLLCLHLLFDDSTAAQRPHRRPRIPIRVSLLSPVKFARAFRPTVTHRSGILSMQRACAKTVLRASSRIKRDLLGYVLVHVCFAYSGTNALFPVSSLMERT